MVPWLKKAEQAIAFPPGVSFEHPDDQREYVKSWLIRDANLPSAARKLNISFYAASYHEDYHSVFPMGDISHLIPDELADVCILEEPEHLNWYKAPFTAKAWMDKFNHVIGIIHTNYLMYARSQLGGTITEPFLYYVNQGVCRAYCHKIIKLSGALQEFAAEKEVIENVHGVRSQYLSIGDRAAGRQFSKGAYFVGKMAWPKGLRELFRLMGYVEQRTGKSFELDAYGQGPHLEEIKAAAAKSRLPVRFFGAKDHSLLTDYRVFVNPSESEVLCTTIVEALAMGKWVVCAKHPSNDFFEQFPNCLTFRNEEEFAANVFWAINNDPRPLTRDQRHMLSWDAAMERLQQAALLTYEEQARSRSSTDRFLAWLLEQMGSGLHGDLVRLLAGGRAAASQIEYTKKYGSALPVLDDIQADKLVEQEAEQLSRAIARRGEGKKDSGAELEFPGADMEEIPDYLAASGGDDPSSPTNAPSEAPATAADLQQLHDAAPPEVDVDPAV